jgi:hypothetical protein
MPDKSFPEVRVVLRAADGAERAWMVQVDPKVPLPTLLPELVEKLPIEPKDRDFQITQEGSLSVPVLVISVVAESHVLGYREAD